VQNIKGSADVLLESAGITFEELQPVADAMERSGRKAAAQAVSDELLRKVCPIAGTPDECIQSIEEYRAAGCTHIMLEIWERIGSARQSFLERQCCRSSNSCEPRVASHEQARATTTTTNDHVILRVAKNLCILPGAT